MTEHPPASDAHLTEHFFRQEWGRMVAKLCRQFGTHALHEIEDAIQHAMVQAMLSWRTVLPDNPAGWLYRVAYNRMLDQLRHDAVHQRSVESLATEMDIHHPATTEDQPFYFVDHHQQQQGLNDELLKLVFVVCHPELAPRAQWILALKHVCGFGVDEIARGLMMQREAVKKQLQRAAKRFKALKLPLELPSSSDLESRCNHVHNVLYLIFNEGYSCTSGEQVIQMDVCAEAARLCHLLAVHPIGRSDTRALLALMMLHAARMPARVDQHGNTVLLEQQDRSLWDQDLIHEAGRWLQSVHSDFRDPASSDNSLQLNRYFLEASIAWAHCNSADWESTPWPFIIQCYDGLIRLHDTPTYRLNRAIANAHVVGSKAALAELSQTVFDESPQLPGLLCARAWLLEQSGQSDEAQALYDLALESDLAPHERRLIETRRQSVNALTSASASSPTVIGFNGGRMR